MLEIKFHVLLYLDVILGIHRYDILQVKSLTGIPDWNVWSMRSPSFTIAIPTSGHVMVLSRHCVRLAAFLMMSNGRLDYGVCVGTDSILMFLNHFGASTSWTLMSRSHILFNLAKVVNNWILSQNVEASILSSTRIYYAHVLWVAHRRSGIFILMFLPIAVFLNIGKIIHCCTI